MIDYWMVFVPVIVGGLLSVFWSLQLKEGESIYPVFALLLVGGLVSFMLLGAYVSNFNEQRSVVLESFCPSYFSQDGLFACPSGDSYRVFDCDFDRVKCYWRDG